MKIISILDPYTNRTQPVILNQVENELQETTHSATNTLVLYMEQIEAAFRAAGVTVGQIEGNAFTDG